MKGQKSALRATMRQVRRQIVDRPGRSSQIAAHFWRTVCFDDSITLAGYLAVRDEVDADSIVIEAWRRGIRVAVPYCDGPDLRFVTIRAWNDVTVGSFGVREPVVPLRTVGCTGVEELNILLVPGLAFDRQGGRLGYGRGYYDKVLSQRHKESVAIGLAFDAQIVAQVPREPHDACVDWLITETGMLRTDAAS